MIRHLEAKLNLLISANFHASRKVNEQSRLIWGLENQQKVYQAPHNSLLGKVVFTLSQNKIFVPHLFKNGNVTKQSCKSML